MLYLPLGESSLQLHPLRLRESARSGATGMAAEENEGEEEEEGGEMGGGGWQKRDVDT